MTKCRLSLTRLGSSQSLKDRAYEALKVAIANMNIYAADAELKLYERDLSVRIGVSRTPLRLALAQLDHEGLIKVVSRRGNFIVRKSKSEILDMIVAWAALESMAARLAAEHASQSALAELHALVDPFDGAAISGADDDYSEANIRFHQAIIAASGNQLITELAAGLLHHVRAIRRLTIADAGRAQRSLADHRAIVAAIERGDGEAAERLVRSHTLHLRDHVAEHVDLD